MKKKLHVDGKSFEVEVKETKDIIDVSVNSNKHRIDLSKKTLNGFRSLFVDGEPYEVYCEVKDEGHFLLWIGHNCYDIKYGESFGSEETEEALSVICAPMPGLVAKVKVKENDKVSKGDPILILEAMKMQNELKSPKDGIIKEILINEGTKVSLGQKLIVLE
jgi:biotin carboxyl carrier protein